MLDLSARNRLISTPRGLPRGEKIEIVDERSEEVFRLLVRERKAMSFLPGVEEPDDGAGRRRGSPHSVPARRDEAADGTPTPATSISGCRPA